MTAPAWFYKAVELRRNQYLATLTPNQRAEYLQQLQDRRDLIAYRASCRERQRSLFPPTSPKLVTKNPK
jgi:hypothetical protein